MSSLENMKVCQIQLELEQWEDKSVSYPISNWDIIKELACFIHTEHCEFIIFVGGNSQYKKETRAKIEKSHITQDIKDILFNAQDKQYDYVCLYG